MRSRPWFPGIVFLALTVLVPALIFAQQNRSARRQPGTPTDRSTNGAGRTKPKSLGNGQVRSEEVLPYPVKTKRRSQLISIPC